MADSVTTTAIPQSVTIPGVGEVPISLKAGYVTGSFIHNAPIHVSIDVNGTDPYADVLDYEPGNVHDPQGAIDWTKRHNAVRKDYPAILYMDRADLTPVFNAANAAGLEIDREFRLWIATLDGTRRVGDMTGVTAVQAWGEGLLGINIDVSVIYDDAWKTTKHDPPLHEVAGPMPGYWTGPVTATGSGLDERAWTTVYSPVSGTWSTPKSA